MNMHLYPKLAWHGIIKNKKTYVPFLLTSIGLVMMFYIVSYLTYNKSVKQMRGGSDMQMILSWGVPVVAFFVVIFLFYMNSFRVAPALMKASAYCSGWLIIRCTS